MDTERLLAAATQFVTPLAAVDLEVVERNLSRVARVASDANVGLRPHAKTHKSPWVAQRQLEHGAVGLTVATLHEAEVFLEAGVGDLLLAHPPAGDPKLRRLHELAERTPRLGVVVDDLELAAALPSRVDVLWEVDSGLHRTGSPPGAGAAEAVGRLVDRIGGERFRGLTTHGGHSYRAATRAARQAVAREEAASLRVTADALRDAGIEVRELSVGSTPTAEFVGAFPWVTEMRPGTYVLGDANQVALGTQTVAECALGVVATVISRPAPDRVVLDAGSKALSTDSSAPGTVGLAAILGHPGLTLERFSEEHGVAVGDPGGLVVGDRVVVLPNHVCTTVNLHPALLCISATDAEWRPVAARGWQ